MNYGCEACPGMKFASFEHMLVHGHEAHGYPDPLDKMKEKDKRIKDLELQNDDFRGCLESIDRRLREEGQHKPECPGNHPAYCICLAGEIRRGIKMTLEGRESKKRVGDIPDIPKAFREAKTWVEANSGSHSLVGLCWCGSFHDR